MMAADEKTTPLSQLQILLEKQIQAAMRSDFTTVEKLTAQTEIKVQELLKCPFPKNPDFEKQHKYVLGLYKKLDLIMAGEKFNLLKQQKLTDNALKAISAYYKNS
jgi:hypothetical protein